MKVFARYLALFVASISLAALCQYLYFYPQISSVDESLRNGIDQVSIILKGVRRVDVVRVYADEFRDGALRYYESRRSRRMDNALFMQWCEKMRPKNRSVSMSDSDDEGK